MNDERGTMSVGPTIVRGVLFLPPSLFTLHSSLFSLSGQKVMALNPGANDVSRIPPGVYFIREQSVVSSQHSGLPAADCRKVMITK